MSNEEEDDFAAFGSESESEDEQVIGGSDDDTAAKVLLSKTSANAATLHITTFFLSKRHTTPLSDRYVALSKGDDEDSLYNSLSGQLSARGVNVITPCPGDQEDIICDAAVFSRCINDDDAKPPPPYEQLMKRGLVPGGIALLSVFNNMATSKSTGNIDGADAVMDVLDMWNGSTFDEAVWDIEHAEVIHHRSIPGVGLICTVISIIKRPCTVNTASCPWKDLSCLVPKDLAQFEGETWLMHERSIVADAAITRTASEVLAHKQSPQPLSEESIRAAVHALKKHGFVVLKNVFDPETLTLPWGDAILTDFEAAANILRERDNIDLINPGRDGMSDPLNYREMAMREDLRVDLRDGPTIQTSRVKENQMVYQDLGLQIDVDEDKGPTIVASTEGSCGGSMRFHPSILRIVRALFNPHAEEDMIEGDGNTKLYSGNFGRWNFGGAGPDGTPQPLRVGQVGAVISLPGSADQAIHADTPHLFEHVDCLPCHYANLFSPGAKLEGKYDADGNFTGEMDSGGTAFVHGSHKLSVTAKMTAEQPGSGVEKESTVFSAASSVANERAMHVRIVRPSLQLGDALIFDCRVLHFGLANLSKVDAASSSSGRRPMLYINMTHVWFHDPKNWDLRKEIF